MKRWIGFLLLTVACILPSLALPGDTELQTTATRQPPTIPTSRPTQTTIAPVPTFTPTSIPPTSTPIPRDPQLSREGVLILPRPLSADDRLTIDVDPVILDYRQRAYTVTLELPDGRSMTSPVLPMGLTEKPQARFYWLAPLESVNLTATFTVTLTMAEDVFDANPGNNQIVFSEPVRSQSSLLPPEPDAQWTYTETLGYRLYYLTGGTADRDLDELIQEADSAYRDVAARLGHPEELVDVYIADRIIGQGGYASSAWVAFSYTDRKYAPVTLGSVLRHELVHRLDRALDCDTAPAFLREGLAVYVAGGHYEPEPLRQRAATLLTSEHYIPLPRLVNDFYTHHHEVGYWEAGAFVQYLVEMYGWDSVSGICKASSNGSMTDPSRNPKHEWDALNAAFTSLGIGTFAETERAWEAWLAGIETSSSDRALLEGKTRLMTRMRAYQRHKDIAAHFTKGVLFSPAEAERLGIVADFIRRPREPASIAIELLLAMGYEAFLQRDLVMLNLCIDSIDALLAGDSGASSSKSGAELAEEVLEIVNRTLAKGYEPYRLLMQRPGRYQVQVLDLTLWPQKREMVAVMDSGAWVLQ